MKYLTCAQPDWCSTKQVRTIANRSGVRTLADMCWLAGDGGEQGTSRAWEHASGGSARRQSRISQQVFWAPVLSLSDFSKKSVCLHYCCSGKRDTPSCCNRNGKSEISEADAKQWGRSKGALELVFVVFGCQSVWLWWLPFCEVRIENSLYSCQHVCMMVSLHLNKCVNDFTN